MSEQPPLLPAFEAVVVGARAAGAACALLLARRGLSVLVVDRGRYGTDTLSTHALMRGGVVQLHRWGLLDAVREAATPPVREASFHYADETMRFPIKSRDGVDALAAPRRTILDRILVDAARQAGATVLHGTRLVDLSRAEGGRVTGAVIETEDGRVQHVRTNVVVGADGVGSVVARLAKAGVYREGRYATGVVYGYWSGVAAEGYGWYFRPGVAVGAIPTNNGETCVFVATSRDRFHREIRHDVEGGYQQVLRECSPALADLVGRGRRSGHLHGFPGQVGFFRRSWGEGWALVGDAGYFKDPLTAHGITDAFRDAELLADAVVGGTAASLGGYERARDEFASTLFELTDDIASFRWDMDAIRQKHRLLNEELARESSAIAAFDARATNASRDPSVRALSANSNSPL